MASTERNMAAILFNIGLIYSDQGNIEEVLDNLNEDLDVAATLTDMVVVYKSETHRECRRRRVQV